MAKKQGRTGDEETDEILEEMESEGIDTSSLGVEPKKEDNSDQVTTDPEEEESSEETEEESADDDETTAEDESDEEDSDDDDDSEEGEEEDDDDGDADKSKKKTLVQKYRSEKKLRKETQAALASAIAAKSDEAFEAEITKFATTNKMNVDVAKGLIELAAKRAGLPKDVMEDIQNSRKERRNTEYWTDQRKKFTKDFNDNVKPVLASLGKKDADIEKVFATLDADEKSPAWAWAKANKDKSLVQLALGIVRTSGNRISSETGGRRVRTPSGKAAEDMTPEDIESMSDEEFDKYSDALGKQKSVVHRSS